MEENHVKAPITVLLIGGSAGSLNVLLKALPQLRKDIKICIVIVLHRKSSFDSSLVQLLSTQTSLSIKEAEEKEDIKQGTIYLAPPDYHLLIEKDCTFSLDFSEKINYSRPCIDVTFETGADAFGHKVAALLLSGANSDGTAGIKAVKSCGGITAVQNPEDAEVAYMPAKAITATQVDYILNADEMGAFINALETL